MADRINKILSFLKLIDQFKLVERRIYRSDGKAENDAEHSWHLAMFLILFEKELPPHLDFKKLIKLALIHDLVEIYAGDTFAFDKEGQTTKKAREMEAAQKLFPQLPEDLAHEYGGLFQEFELQESAEAKLVKSFDKIQAILQNLCSQGKSWKENGVSFKDVDDYKRKHMLHNDFVLKLYEMLLGQAKESGLL